MKPHILRFPKFVVTGIVNTLFGYALYSLALLWGGLQPPIALAVATLAGALFNYFTTARLVFEERRLHRLPRFLLVYGGVYGLNLALLALFMRLWHDPLAAQALALPFVVLLSYAAMTFWVFPQQGRA